MMVAILSLHLKVLGLASSRVRGDVILNLQPTLISAGYAGRSLSMISTSIMAINPDIPDAHVLRGWYDSVGVNQSFTAYSIAGSGPGGAATFNRADIRTIEEIKENVQIAEKAQMFSCRGTVLHIKGDNPAYPACPNQSCKKKVTDTGEGWHCEKCEQTWEKPEYRYRALDPDFRTTSAHNLTRYIISMAVSDHTGQAWLQGFHDVGLAVFNMSADELMDIKVRSMVVSRPAFAKQPLPRTTSLGSTPQSCPSPVILLSTSPAARNSTPIKIKRGCDTESRGSFHWTTRRRQVI